MLKIIPKLIFSMSTLCFMLLGCENKPLTLSKNECTEKGYTFLVEKHFDLDIQRYKTESVCLDLSQ